LQIYTVNQVINKQKDDFKLHFADDLANFSDFNEGDILASESGTEYRAQMSGEAIVFPNAKVEIGQRALLTVVPCEL
jgi:succinylglutamate desuccinylase